VGKDLTTPAKVVGMKEEKLRLSEDSRTELMSWALTQARCPGEILRKLKVVLEYVNFESYEEAAPISTLETGIQAVLLEFSELIITSEESLEKNDQISKRSSYEEGLFRGTDRFLGSHPRLSNAGEGSKHRMTQ